MRVFSYLDLWIWMGGRGFPPDALAPRSLSGVPVKSRWAITVGTYSSLQEKASGLNDETHQSSSQSGLTCQVSCSWWHIHGERMHMVGVLYEALWEPVFTHSGGDHLNTALSCVINMICGCLQASNQVKFEQKSFWGCWNQKYRRYGEVKQPEVLVLGFSFREPREESSQYRVADVLWNRLRRRRSPAHGCFWYFGDDPSKTLLPSWKVTSEVTLFRLPSTHLLHFAFNISITGSYLLLQII